MKFIKVRIREDQEKEVQEFLNLLPAGSLEVLIQNALDLYMEVEGRVWMKKAVETREQLQKDWKKAKENREHPEEDSKKRHPVTLE